MEEKQVGDFTIREMKKICDARLKRGFPYCVECRFYDVCGVPPEDMTQADLNKKVKAEEDEELY